MSCFRVTDSNKHIQVFKDQTTAKKKQKYLYNIKIVVIKMYQINVHKVKVL